MRAAAQTADLVLYLVDGVEGLTDEDRRELDAIGVPRLVVYTKADLARRNDELSISAVSDAGMPLLMDRLDTLVKTAPTAAQGAHAASDTLETVSTLNGRTLASKLGSSALSASASA